MRTVNASFIHFFGSTLIGKFVVNCFFGCLFLWISSFDELPRHQALPYLPTQLYVCVCIFSSCIYTLYSDLYDVSFRKLQFIFYFSSMQEQLQNYFTQIESIEHAFIWTAHNRGELCNIRPFRNFFHCSHAHTDTVETFRRWCFCTDISRKIHTNNCTNIFIQSLLLTVAVAVYTFVVDINVILYTDPTQTNIHTQQEPKKKIGKKTHVWRNDTRKHVTTRWK